MTAAETERYLGRTMTRAARREFGRVQNASLNGAPDAVLASAGVEGTFPVRSAPGEAEEAPEEDTVTVAEAPPAQSAEEAEAALGLTRAQRVLVQRGLAALEFNVGAADGLFGARTRAAIGQWQEAQGATATGHLDAKDAETLLQKGEATPPPEPRTRVVQAALVTLNEALATARGITEDRWRVGALSFIAQAQAKAGDIPGALATARGITDAGYRALTLSDIAGAQVEAANQQP